MMKAVDELIMEWNNAYESTSQGPFFLGKLFLFLIKIGSINK